MLEATVALLRQHTIAPQHFSASRTAESTNEVGQREIVDVDVARFSLFGPRWNPLRVTFIEAIRTVQEQPGISAPIERMRTGMAIYSVLGLIPLGRSRGYQEGTDINGQRFQRTGVDMGEIHSALSRTALRRGAFTNIP